MEIFALTLLTGAIVFLHYRGFRDGAFSDPILFLTGISLVGYVIARPHRTRAPTAVAISAVLLLVALPYVRRTLSTEQSTYQELREGTDAYSADEFARAIAIFSNVIQHNPDSFEALCGRGFAYLQMQKLEEAIEDFTRVIKLEPTLADAYRGRGVAYFEIGEDDRAIRDLTEALRLDPEDVESFHNRGVAYHFKGDQRKSLIDLETCEQLGGIVDRKLLSDVRDALDRDNERSER